MLDFRILGPVEVLDGERAVPLGGERQRGLLVLLLLDANRVVSTDRLIDQLWGERPPANVSNALQATVARLRRALPEDGSGGPIVTRQSGYAIRIDPEALDWLRFSTLLDEGTRKLAEGDHRAASSALSAALAVWRGPALADLAFKPFAEPAIAALSEARTAASERWCEAELALGRHTDVLIPLTELVQEHPYNETFRRQLMLALYRCGRQADALEAYREARETLVGDLGIEPGPDLQQLQRSILEQDPRLGPHQRPFVGPARRRRVLRRSLLAAPAAAPAVAGLVVLTTGAGGRSVTVAADSLAAIDLQRSTLKADVRLPAQPDAVVAALGSIWVANQDNRLLMRIDPATGKVTHTVGLDLSPDSLSGSTNRLWLMDSRAARLAELTPDIAGVLDAANLGGSALGSIAVGKGTIWVAQKEFPAVLRVDPESGSVVKRILLPVDGIPGSGGPSTIAVAGRSVWVGNYGGDLSRAGGDTYGFLAAIDPATDRVTHVDRFSEGPAALAYGDGLLWAVFSGKNEVVAVDPSTAALVANVAVGRDPDAIAIAGGAVWVADAGDDNVTKIDPETDRVVRTIRLDRRPLGLAAARGRLWAAVG